MNKYSQAKKFVLLFFMTCTSLTLFGQFKSKDVKSLSRNYEYVIETRENHKGWLLSYKQFKRGVFADASNTERATFMTTMLLGSGDYLYKYLQDHSMKFSPEVNKPNGFTSTKFIITYKSEDVEVRLIRKMVYGSTLIPGAAENPENYGMLVGFTGSSARTIELLIDSYQEFLNTHDIVYTIHSSSQLQTSTTNRKR